MVANHSSGFWQLSFGIGGDAMRCSKGSALRGVTSRVSKIVAHAVIWDGREPVMRWDEITHVGVGFSCGGFHAVVIDPLGTGQGDGVVLPLLRPLLLFKIRETVRRMHD